MKCALLPQSLHLLLFLVLTRLCRTRPPPNSTAPQLVHCNITSSNDPSEQSMALPPREYTDEGVSPRQAFPLKNTVEAFSSRHRVPRQYVSPKHPATYTNYVPDSTSSEDDYMDYYYYDDFDYLDSEKPSQDNLQAENQPPPGLSRVAKLKLLKTPRRQPPEYMLDLYDRFTKLNGPLSAGTTPRPVVDDPYLGADIVRSFPSINKETKDTDVASTERPDSGQQLPGRETRHHTLVFNLTSMLTGEEVSRAELRLYTLVAKDRSTYIGEDRLVTVHEGLRPRHLPPVASRHMYGRSSGWEAFDVTEVVRKWVNGGPAGQGDGVHVLEVAITSVFNSKNSSALDMDIDVDPEHNEGPLLVVFSRDVRWHKRYELQDLIDHEADATNADFASTLEDSAYDTLKQLRDASKSRTRRDARMGPRSDSLSGVSTSHTVGRRDDIFTGVATKQTSPHVLRRVRRDAETKRKRNSCRRKPMYVDFQEINWHQWIIAPPGYQAFECVGKCYIPIGAYLSPTKHAIIQTLVHAAHPKQASRACCVPTKLEPISILYLDENNIITYKYHYDEMVVAECGCR